MTIINSAFMVFLLPKSISPWHISRSTWGIKYPESCFLIFFTFSPGVVLDWWSYQAGLTADAPVSPGGHDTVFRAPLSDFITSAGAQPRDTVAAVLLSLQICFPLVSESQKYL